jgi:alkanesulfonate monooxygenase SsuD/methylene tetrahydromethanopterin reductase-like flavin-dependent oxidoreductase (luciferase family)
VKFGLEVVPEHPADAPMVQMLDEALGQTRAARDHGYDTVSVGHHYLTTPFQYVQPIPTLARLAGEAGAMTLATTVLLIALMHPVDLAEQVATLDNLAGGRLVLGVGLGYRDEEFAAFGVPRGGRVARFEENLRLVRRLWTEPAVTYTGPGWELREARVSIRPAQRPHPPIWMAANADAAVRRAARLADAWLVNNHASLGTLERQMGIYRDELARCGRPFPAELPMIRSSALPRTPRSPGATPVPPWRRSIGASRSGGRTGHFRLASGSSARSGSWPAIASSSGTRRRAQRRSSATTPASA